MKSLSGPLTQLLQKKKKEKRARGAMPDESPPAADGAASPADTVPVVGDAWRDRKRELEALWSHAPAPTTTTADAAGPAATTTARPTPVPLPPAPTTRHDFANLVGVDAWIPPDTLKPVKRLGSGSFATGKREMSFFLLDAATSRALSPNPLCPLIPLSPQSSCATTAPPRPPLPPASPSSACAPGAPLMPWT